VSLEPDREVRKKAGPEVPSPQREITIRAFPDHWDLADQSLKGGEGRGGMLSHVAPKLFIRSETAYRRTRGKNALLEI